MGAQACHRQGCLRKLKYPLRKSEMSYSMERSRHIYLEIHMIDLIHSYCVNENLLEREDLMVTEI